MHTLAHNGYFPLVISLGIIFGGISSCNDENSVLQQYNTKNSYFPNKIGSWWKYMVYDTSAGTSYEQTVSIVDSFLLNDTLTVTRWVTSDSLRTDTALIAVIRDTVWRYYRYTLYSEIVLIIPANVGQTWSFWCAPMVIDQLEFIRVPRAGHPMSYILHHTWRCLNAGGEGKKWFAPYFGFVKKYEREYESCCVVYNPGKVWKLKDYYFPTN